MASGFETPDNYKFVIAKTDDDEENFEFTEYSPSDFMEFSYIPPFKIYFNVSLKGETKKRKRKTAVALTNDRMKLLTEAHYKIRE